MKWLKENGFPTVQTKTVATPEEVIAVREEVASSIRDSLDFDIDGLVIKGNRIDLEDMKRARPMKQIAFKFPAEQIETKVLDVEWSISGHNYTPVAVVETVKLMGSNISRASLANPGLLQELNLKIGATVVISKRGDIIPKIERVLSTPEDAQEIVVPSVCEVCGTTLVNDTTHLYCPNEACPKRLYHRLVKWIKTLGVKHFSEKLMLQKLFDSGKVQTIPDLYHLKVSDLTRFDQVKEPSAQKALNNLYAVKEIPLETFIGGFDIEGIGERMVKKVVEAGYDTLEKIKKASVHDIARIEGFADITASLLVKGLKELEGDMMTLLSTKKIAIKGKSLRSASLKGLSFCFTGKLNSMKRPEAEALVSEHGGVPKSSLMAYIMKNVKHL